MPDDQASPDRGAARGREAGRPQQIPPAGWKDVLWRAWHDVGTKNLSLIAGGVTYSVLAALFPALAVLVSLYGLLFDPNQVEKQVGALSAVLPGDTRTMIAGELHHLVQSSSGALSVGAVIAFLLALWSASRGVSGLISALNIAYDQPERRGFFRYNALVLGLTLGLMVFGVVVIAFVAGLPAVIGWLGLGSFGQWLLLVLEWPILIGVFMAGLAVLFRLGPDRDRPQWQWVSPGALVATLLWIIASIGFTVYVAHFNSYNATYGSLGAVIILLTWLWLSAFVVLLGAEINAEAEKQTRQDTTVGPPEPMGHRDATAADTLGRSYGKPRPDAARS
jgi:membrane protein